MLRMESIQSERAEGREQSRPEKEVGGEIKALEIYETGKTVVNSRSRLTQTGQCIRDSRSKRERASTWASLHSECEEMTRLRSSGQA